MNLSKNIFAACMVVLVSAILVGIFIFLRKHDAPSYKPAPVRNIENTERFNIDGFCRPNEDMTVRNCFCEGIIKGKICKDIDAS